MSIHRNLSEHEYAACLGIRASWVKTLARSTPAHLWQQMSEPMDSDALRVGRALHDCVLTPDEFSSRWAAAPKVDRRTKAGKEAYEAFMERCAVEGLGALTADEAAMVSGVAASIAATNAGSLLALAPEREVVLTGSIGGIDAKCRIDACCLETGLLIDIKTTQSASARAFSRSVIDYGYLIQMAFYRELLLQNGADVGGPVVLIACEKSAPYAVALYSLSSADLDRILPTVESLAQRLHRCFESKEWPAYSPLVQPLEMPEWAFAASGEEAIL